MIVGWAVVVVVIVAAAVVEFVLLVVDIVVPHVRQWVDFVVVVVVAVVGTVDCHVLGRHFAFLHNHPHGCVDVFVVGESQSLQCLQC